MSLIFIILSETFISYSTFIQFSGDFFFSLQDYVKFSLYANICECVWCIYCFKSHWESADCLLPLSFFHLSINLLRELCVCVCFPSSLQYVYAFRDESSRKIMEGKSL